MNTDVNYFDELMLLVNTYDPSIKRLIINDMNGLKNPHAARVIESWLEANGDYKNYLDRYLFDNFSVIVEHTASL
jgi:rRNA-processing protein FCF1